MNRSPPVQIMTFDVAVMAPVPAELSIHERCSSFDIQDCDITLGIA
ncbi:MAG TPA: hypothetical protein VF960_02275 [Chloroflexota bacterium]